MSPSLANWPPSNGTDTQVSLFSLTQKLYWLLCAGRAGVCFREFDPSGGLRCTYGWLLGVGRLFKEGNVCREVIPDAPPRNLVCLMRSSADTPGGF